MEIGYAPAKRDKPLKERGLDFEDTRKDYDERRWVTIGFLSGRMVVVGWPPRNQIRRVFSMRRANEREQTRYQKQFSTS